MELMVIELVGVSVVATPEVMLYFGGTLALSKLDFVLSIRLFFSQIGSETEQHFNSSFSCQNHLD